MDSELLQAVKSAIEHHEKAVGVHRHALHYFCRSLKFLPMFEGLHAEQAADLISDVMDVLDNGEGDDPWVASIKDVAYPIEKFMHTWPKTSTALGAGLIDHAQRMAKEEPYPIPNGHRYHRALAQQLASLHWYLHRINEDTGIYFVSERKSIELLGLDEGLKRSVNRTKNRLIEFGYFEEVKKGNQKDGASRFRWVGPTIEEAKVGEIPKKARW